jgi:hemerythrin-like domain-containing protein
MAITDFAREQHHDLIGILGEISMLINRSNIAIQPHTMRHLIAKFINQFKIHLAGEREFIYPQLMAHNDAAIRQTAKQYQQEMSSIDPMIESWHKKWSISAIASDTNTFMDETESIFTAVKKRIDKEENELYPLADKGFQYLF